MGFFDPLFPKTLDGRIAQIRTQLARKRAKEDSTGRVGAPKKSVSQVNAEIKSKFPFITHSVQKFPHYSGHRMRAAAEDEASLSNHALASLCTGAAEVHQLGEVMSTT